MENKIIKNIGKILLIGCIGVQTTIADEAGASHSDMGTYSVEVQEIRKVWISKDTEASKTDATEILQNTSENTYESPLALEFIVLTNLEEWDLELETENRGKLLRKNDKIPLKTNAAPDGSLGNGGSLYVSLKEIEEGEISNVEPLEGNDVDVSNGKVNLALAAFGKTELFQSPELVKAVFEVRAGLEGEKIMAPPGIYTETVTITIIGKTN